MTSKKIRDKLNNRGASVILALVVFLIVSFVSIAIVNAAILNARRTAKEKMEEKAYIATSEGIRLIQRCMKDDAAYVKKEGSESKLTGMDDSLGEAVKEMADSMCTSSKMNTLKRSREAAYAAGRVCAGKRDIPMFPVRRRSKTTCRRLNAKEA